MTSMVGVDQSNVKNSVKVNGTYLKYEPIFILQNNLTFNEKVQTSIVIRKEII